MAVNLAPVARPQFFDNDVEPADGGTLSTYVAGSSTPLPTYTDSTGLTANPVEIPLNARGEPANGIWLTEGLAYKFVYRDPTGSVIWTEDNVRGINDSSIATDEWFTSGWSPTYVGASSFSIPGDQLTSFNVGRRVKATVSGGTRYGTITSSTFASNTTTIVLSMDSGSLDAGLSAVSLARLSASNPTTPFYNLRQRGLKRDYAAKGDGATSDQTPLNSALAAGVPLLVEDGTYPHATGLTISHNRARIQGASPPVNGNVDDAGPVLSYTGSGTGLRIGATGNFDGSGTAIDDVFLVNPEVESIRLHADDATAIAVRAYMLSGGKLRNLDIFGQTAGIGLKVEGCIHSEFASSVITGPSGATDGTGIAVTNGFDGAVTTSTDFYKMYIRSWEFGSKPAGLTNWIDCIWEACDSGLVIEPGSVTNVLLGHFEANITQDVYFSDASVTVLRDVAAINSYAREHFFSGNVPKLVHIENCNLSTDHVAPKLFTDTSFAGARIILRDNIFPPGLEIGGLNITWKNVELNGMQVVVYTFRQTGVAANTTYAMPQANGSTLTVDLPHKGNILGTRTQYSGTVSAGNYTTTVEKNGVAVANMTNSAVTTNVSSKDSQYLLNRFVAGDKLQAKVQTSAAFAATGGEFITEVIVALGNDGL